MSRAKYFTFKIGDQVELLTLSEASKRPELWARIDEILLNLQNKRMKDDGFKPGFQDNINEYVGGRKEYDRRLKELGLQEVGYDYTPQEVKADYQPLAGKEMAQTIAEMDPTMTGQELAAIETGEYFKNIAPAETTE